jgi:twinkle protein
VFSRVLSFPRLFRALAHKGLQRILPKGGEWGFFGWHTVFTAPGNYDPDSNAFTSDRILITEGEYDCMAAAQAIATITDASHPLAHLPCVSLPNGCNSLPLEMIPQLDRFKVYRITRL